MVALGKDGHVYRWGGDGRLPTVPELLLGNLEDKKVVEIACGQLHCLCLTSDGQVYSWGNNSNGTLGLGQTCEYLLEPDLVPFNVKIQSIECGTINSFALDVDGNVSFFCQFCGQPFHAH